MMKRKDWETGEVVIRCKWREGSRFMIHSVRFGCGYMAARRVVLEQKLKTRLYPVVVKNVMLMHGIAI